MRSAVVLLLCALAFVTVVSVAGQWTQPAFVEKLSVSKSVAEATATLESSVWLHGGVESLSAVDNAGRNAGVASAAAGVMAPDDGRHGLETDAPRAHYATLWLDNTWKRSRDYCARAAAGTLCTIKQLCPNGEGRSPIGHREIPHRRRSYSPVADGDNMWVQLVSAEGNKKHRCTVVDRPAWGSARKKMGSYDSEMDNDSKSIVACCNNQGVIKSYLRLGAREPGEGRSHKKSKRKSKRGGKRDCTKIGTGYPSAGSKICCPKGMTRYGDGSACKATGKTSCALWGNYGLKRCSKKLECTTVWSDYPDAKKGDQLCCPKGMARYGDGSACKLEGRTTCALWSNLSLPRCPKNNGKRRKKSGKRDCTTVGAGYLTSGKKVCCPKGMTRYGDGSACKADGRTSCALWGNYSLKRCGKKRECGVIGAGYANAGEKTCCPKGLARYGDGSACRWDGVKPTCALWGNDSLPRCPKKSGARDCTTVGAGYLTSGKKVCCPKGMTRYGDGSACKATGKTSCALWGNYSLKRCSKKRECGVIGAGYANAGEKVCCAKGFARYGDGSACRWDGQRPSCALWGNDSLPRCPTRGSVGRDRVHLSFDFTSRDFTSSYATFPCRVSDPNDKSNNLLLPYLFGSNAAPERAGTLDFYAHGKLMNHFTKASGLLTAGKAYHVDLLWRPLKGTTQFIISEVATGAVITSQTATSSTPLSVDQWKIHRNFKWAVIQGDTRWYVSKGGRQHGKYDGTVSNIKCNVDGNKIPIVTV